MDREQQLDQFNETLLKIRDIDARGDEIPRGLMDQAQQEYTQLGLPYLTVWVSILERRRIREQFGDVIINDVINGDL